MHAQKNCFFFQSVSQSVCQSICQSFCLPPRKLHTQCKHQSWTFGTRRHKSSSVVLFTFLFSCFQLQFCLQPNSHVPRLGWVWECDQFTASSVGVWFYFTYAWGWYIASYPGHVGRLILYWPLLVSSKTGFQQLHAKLQFMFS